MVLIGQDQREQTQLSQASSLTRDFSFILCTICKHITHRNCDAVGYAQNFRSFLNNVFAYGELIVDRNRTCVCLLSEAVIAIRPLRVLRVMTPDSGKG